MRKTIAILLVVVLLAVALFTLTACDDKKEETVVDTSTSTETPEVTTGGTTSGSGFDKALVGQWKNHSYGYDYVYTFNEDGTGKYDAAGTIMEFTCTTNGNQISILYTGNTVSFDTEYSIDGDTLNVKDSMGNDTLYEKVK